MTEAPRMLQALQPTAAPGWVLRQQGFDPLRDSSRESRFAVSNGFLGIRGGRAIDRAAGSAVVPRIYVAGLFDRFGTVQPETLLVDMPYWLQVSLSLGAVSSDLIGGDMLFHQRVLDIKRGLLITQGRMTAAPGVAVQMRVLRLVSLSRRGLGLQLAQMDVETGIVDATLEASFERLEFGLATERLEQDLGVWRTHTSAKRLALATAASLRVDGELVPPVALGPFRWSWTWRTRPGQSVCFERMVAVVREDDAGTAAGAGAAPGALARGELDAGRALGWTGALAAHEASWAKRWQDSDVVVRGDAVAQHGLRFALYHLNGAANPADDRVSIAARGLTGPDYHGHVFWDTEIFLLPFYTWTWPEAARALLLYRFRTLDAARAKAAAMGWRGALYAWESADTGAETTPEHAIGPDRHVVAILCGSQEQHISADVAYAVWQYWQVTGDDAFLRDAGAEILFETARFWSSRAQLEPDGRHHIRGVIGPDEYHETIDDNAYTNVMARWTIERGIAVAAVMRRQWPECWAALSARIGLDEAELQLWASVAATMATGLDASTGLFEQFAGFFQLETIELADYAGRSVPMDVVLGRERIKTAQVVKQADVVALLALLPDLFAGAAAAANFAYYAPRCSHGSSLSRAMHGLAAARLGQSDVALRYFKQTSAIDLADTHAAIDGGVHIAALGGVWMIAVLGFAGLAMDDDGIRLDPHLPAGWDSLAFPVQWRGRHVTVRIGRAGLVRVALLTGDPIAVTIAGIRHDLGPGAPVYVKRATYQP